MVIEKMTTTIKEDKLKLQKYEIVINTKVKNNAKPKLNKNSLILISAISSLIVSNIRVL